MNIHTCLIVEDDRDFSDILEAIIKKIPIVKVIGVCDNSMDAARILETKKPEILLLDVNISGLEGPEILELVDHNPKTIIITSHEREVMEHYNVDYVEFIQKPLRSSDQVINAIYNCLN